MEIKNIRVYGLEESIIASGYPMRTETMNEDVFDEYADAFWYHIYTKHKDNSFENNIKRAETLAQTSQGEGHSCFLKGIIVQYDLTAPEYFWRQFDRYHFHDYISSESKMHCITKFDIEKMCNKYVDEEIIQILNEYITLYNDMKADNQPKEKLNEVFHSVISNCPMGLELTARITDNYLQLKSKYIQRRHHKLNDWQQYCDWIETLPMAKELIIPKKKGE